MISQVRTDAGDRIQFLEGPSGFRARVTTEEGKSSTIPGSKIHVQKTNASTEIISTVALSELSEGEQKTAVSLVNRHTSCLKDIDKRVVAIVIKERLERS